MKAILEKLKSLPGPAHPGASKEAIAKAEQDLGIKFPSELLSLYADHDGEKNLTKLPWRLLSIAEALEANKSLTDEKILPPEIRVFWADDEFNFAGVYFDGPLANKVCFFDHEERDFAPRFNSIRNFLEAMIKAASDEPDWRQMTGDISPDAQGDALSQLRARFTSEKNERKRRQLAFDIIALSQPTEIIPYLDDPDLWVQERAAETLGKLRYEPAIPLLVKIAERETTRVHNARIASIVALGRMKSPAGFESLLQLAKAIPAPFHIYLYKALGEHGCPTKFENGQWKFQTNNEWRTL